jgi:hypothetical protein
VKETEESVSESEKELSRAWWFTPLISALRRQKQEDHEFGASLGYMGDPISEREGERRGEEREV